MCTRVCVCMRVRVRRCRGMKCGPPQSASPPLPPSPSLLPLPLQACARGALLCVLCSLPSRLLPTTPVSHWSVLRVAVGRGCHRRRGTGERSDGGESAGALHPAFPCTPITFPLFFPHLAAPRARMRAGSSSSSPRTPHPTRQRLASRGASCAGPGVAGVGPVRPWRCECIIPAVLTVRDGTVTRSASTAAPLKDKSKKHNGRLALIGVTRPLPSPLHLPGCCGPPPLCGFLPLERGRPEHSQECACHPDAEVPRRRPADVSALFLLEPCVARLVVAPRRCRRSLREEDAAPLS